MDGGSSSSEPAAAASIIPAPVLISSNSDGGSGLEDVKRDDDDKEEDEEEEADGQCSECSAVIESSASDDTSLLTDGSTDAAEPCSTSMLLHFTPLLCRSPVPRGNKAWTSALICVTSMQ